MTQIEKEEYLINEIDKMHRFAKYVILASKEEMPDHFNGMVELFYNSKMKIEDFVPICTTFYALFSQLDKLPGSHIPFNMSFLKESHNTIDKIKKRLK